MSKRYSTLVLLLYASLKCLAQIDQRPVIVQNYAPSGACVLTNQSTLVIVTQGVGAGLYQCVAGTWVYYAPGASVLPIAANLTYSPSLAINAALYSPSSSTLRVTLTGNLTLTAPTGAIDGQKLALEFIQGGSGSYSVTLPSNFKFGTDVASYTPSTTVGAADYVGAVYNAGTANWSVVAIVHGYAP